MLVGIPDVSGGATFVLAVTPQKRTTRRSALLISHPSFVDLCAIAQGHLYWLVIAVVIVVEVVVVVVA